MDSARRGGFSCRSIFHYNLYLLSYGLRTQKTDGTVTTDFYWANGNMTYQNDGTNELYFRYDESGAPVSVNINGTDYYYVKNLQGDIIALLDRQGSCVVKYTYDAWGKVLEIVDETENNIGTINPLRYRGYYYDSDLGFYYLQSRYYDPTVGRFLNADEVDYLGASGNILSYNLFAYCENNPVNNIDPYGKWVATIGVTASAIMIWGISASFAFIFDGKGNIGVLFTFNYRNVGISIGAGIAVGFYWNYSTIKKYYNSKLVSLAVPFVEVFGTKQMNKIKGIQLSIGKGLTIAVMSGNGRSKMYSTTWRTLANQIYSLILWSPRRILGNLSVRVV